MPAVYYRILLRVKGGLLGSAEVDSLLEKLKSAENYEYQSLGGIALSASI